MLSKIPIFIFFLSFVFLFVLGIIVFSILVVLLRNPVHAVLSLIVVFCCTTIVFLFLGLEFIAITFLVVYVGAIAVIFLFVVMMLNIKIIELDEIY
jgi:NADH:ubiquinone oxidoreductase subunit 6 (subunit J)